MAEVPEVHAFIIFVYRHLQKVFKLFKYKKFLWHLKSFLFVLGLFHKAICQSGVAVNSNNFQTSNQEFAFKILEVLGKRTSDPKDAVQLLRNFSTQKILEAEMKLLKVEIN